MDDPGEPAGGGPAGGEPPTAGPSFLLGGWTVEVELDRLIRGSRVLHVEPKHMDVLVLLAESPGRVLSKDDILSNVWRDQFVADSVLTRAIGELRRALGDDAHAPRFIETIPRRGYRLVAPVVRDAVERDPVERPRPPASLPEPQPESRRRPHWPLLALGLIVVVAIVWAARRQPRESREPPAPPVAGTVDPLDLRLRHITASPEIETFPSLSSDGQSLAYSSNRSGAFELYVRQLIPGGGEIQLTSDGMGNLQPTWSPGGNLIAYHSQRRGGIWVLPSLGGEPRQLSDFGSYPDWSPDGRWVVFQSEGITVLTSGGIRAMPPSTLWLAPADGGDLRQLTLQAVPPGGHGAPAFSPDGARVVFASSDFGLGGLWTISISGDDLRQVANQGTDPEYAGDGELIYFVGRAQRDEWLLRIRAPEHAGGPVTPEPLLRLQARDLSMSGDGRQLVFSRLAATSNIWTVPISPATAEATGPARPLTRENDTRITAPAISPDGRKVAYVVLRTGALPEIWVIDREGGEPSQLIGEPAGGIWPSWSQDGRHLYFSARRVWHRLELASRRVEALAGLGEGWQSSRLSSDAKKVVFYRTIKGVSNVWTADVDGSRVTQLTHDEETAYFPSWSEDGSQVSIELGRGPHTHVAVVPAAGGPLTQLTFDPGQSWPFSFSPDGDKIFFAGRRDGVWNVYWVSRTDGRVHRLTDHAGGLGAFVRYPASSPTGDLVAYEFREATADIWMIDLPEPAS